MKEKSARRIVIPQPDLMPMTDLAFLLVIFFMISFSALNMKALTADFVSDEGCYVGPVREFTHVEVFIDSRDRVWVENRVCETTAEISDAIDLEMRRLAVNAVQIEFDRESVHGTTVRVVDAATGLRVRSIRMKLG